MHPSHKQIWIPGFIILAALAAVIVWAVSTSSRVYAKPELGAKPELALGPDSASGWRIGEPVTYETLTIFPVLSSQEALHRRFRNPRCSARLGRSNCRRTRRIHAPFAQWRRTCRSKFRRRRASKPTSPRKSRQKTLAPSRWRSGFRRQARSHHRQGPYHPNRRAAAASRCLLRRTQPLDQRWCHLRRRENHGSSHRARTSRH